jgi:hypothetical protein
MIFVILTLWVVLTLTLAPGSAFSLFGTPEDDTFFDSTRVNDMYKTGLARVHAHAKSAECKAKIEKEYMRTLEVTAGEKPMLFEDVHFQSQCTSPLFNKVQPMMPIYMKNPPPKVEKPVPSIPRKPIPASKLRICYLMLVHDNVPQAVRLIRALDESSPSHTFVIMVDSKAQGVFEELKTFAASYNAQAQTQAQKGSDYAVGKEGKENDNSDADASDGGGGAAVKVHVVAEGRQSINWGGYTMVNATMAGMAYAVDEDNGLQFDYLSLISGTTYPIQTNARIRWVLSGSDTGKTNTIFMDISDEPSRPAAELWHMFVECDDRLHRLGRLATPRGMNMYTGGQWFALPRHAAQWLVTDSLPREYAEYAQYVYVILFFLPSFLPSFFLVCDISISVYLLLPACIL